MTIAPALFSSRSEEWETPQDFFDALNREFHFTCDMAATEANAKCRQFLSKDTCDALACSWSDFAVWAGRRGPVWCNPPYGRNIGAWFAKAREAAGNGTTVVMLAHARTDTRWWHEHVQGIADEVRFVKGRLKFIGPDGVKSGAPFPSAVIIYWGKS